MATYPKSPLGILRLVILSVCLFATAALAGLYVYSTSEKICLGGSGCAAYLQFDGTSVNLVSPAGNNINLTAGSVVRFTPEAGSRTLDIDTAVGYYYINPSNGDANETAIIGSRGGSGVEVPRIANASLTACTASTLDATHVRSGNLAYDTTNNALDVCNGTAWVAVGAATPAGTITMTGGTGTATVTSGAVCVCSDTTSAFPVKCAVAATTLTATGTSGDVAAYICNK